MSIKKKEDAKEIALICRALRQLLIRLEMKEQQVKSQHLPEERDENVEEIMWLIGFTPAENRQLNWILNYRHSEIKNNSNIN